MSEIKEIQGADLRKLSWTEYAKRMIFIIRYGEAPSLAPSDIRALSLGTMTLIS